MARRVGHYHTYDEMSDLMTAWAKQYPAIADLESIGQVVEASSRAALLTREIHVPPCMSR